MSFATFLSIGLFRFYISDHRVVKLNQVNFDFFIFIFNFFQFCILLFCLLESWSSLLCTKLSHPHKLATSLAFWLESSFFIFFKINLFLIHFLVFDLLVIALRIFFQLLILFLLLVYIYY